MIFIVLSCITPLNQLLAPSLLYCPRVSYLPLLPIVLSLSVCHLLILSEHVWV